MTWEAAGSIWRCARLSLRLSPTVATRGAGAEERNAERRRRADTSSAGGREGEAAELAVLKEPVGVGLRRYQPHLRIGVGNGLDP